jgi:general secretion pathway protein A
LGLLILTGEPGTGKTTILQRFSAALDETVHLTFLPCAASTFQEILSYLCVQCCLPRPVDDQWIQLALFQEYLQSRAKRGGIEALFIDEAQHLDEETLNRLRILMNLDGQNGKLLQIILAGQTELEEKLAQPNLWHLQQRVAIHYRLLPLAGEEVGSFIQHRLHVAGCARGDIFAPATVQAIAHYSGGIPRLINVICDAALLSAARAGLTIVPAEIIVQVAETLRLTPLSSSQPCDESISEINEPIPETDHHFPVGFGSDPEALSDITSSSLSEEAHHERTIALQTTPSQPIRTRRRLSFFSSHFPQHAVGIGLSILLVWLSSPLLHFYVEQIDIFPKKTPLAENSLSSLQEPTPIREHVAVVDHGDPRNAQALKPLETFPEVASLPISLAPSPLSVQNTETYSLASVQQQEQQPPVPITSAPSSAQSTVTQRPEASQEQRAQMAAVPSTLERPPHTPDREFSRLAEPPFPASPLPPKVSVPVPSFVVPHSLSRIREKRQTATSMPAPPWSLGKTQARKRLASLGLIANPETLFRAADNGYVATVDLVLRAGVSPNSQNTRGWTALMFAARGSSLNLVELLLTRGAQPNMKNETGATALIVAARNNRPAIVQALLRRGAIIDATDRQGWTALMYASSMGHDVMVRTLLNNGAKPRFANKKGWTASMYAAQG